MKKQDTNVEDLCPSFNDLDYQTLELLEDAISTAKSRILKEPLRGNRFIATEAYGSLRVCEECFYGSESGCTTVAPSGQFGVEGSVPAMLDGKPVGPYCNSWCPWDQE